LKEEDNMQSKNHYTLIKEKENKIAIVAAVLIIAIGLFVTIALGSTH
jgi:hypothetical protein